MRFSNDLDFIKRVLSAEDPRILQRLQDEAHRLTRQHFGRTMALYAPLYLGNYCENNCTYCGFSSHHKIKRTRLTEAEMDLEMQHLASQGIQSVLLLTGESERQTPLSYIRDAACLAQKYFPSTSIEVQPLDKDGYAVLCEAGVDGVTVYQETYDRACYDDVHVSGKKKDYDYRYGTPERAARAGMRSISMGILLGLTDPIADICALVEHLRWMERHYPGVEYSVSFPRIVRVEDMDFHPLSISDDFFMRCICVMRILFPRVGINLSTREPVALRNKLLACGVTRFSAGSSTSVGGYTDVRPEGSPQFDIHDMRSVADVVAYLKKQSYDPIFTEWRRPSDVPVKAGC